MTDREHMPEVEPAARRGACTPTRTCSPRRDDDFAWPELDEKQASGLCYTSGTTGHPKGVLYSHRSTVLQALRVQPARTCSACAPSTGCCRSSPCSTSTPGAFPTAATMVGAGAGPRRRQDGRRQPARADRERAGHLRRRRADGLARPGPAPAAVRRPGRWSGAALRRRRGLPAGPARGVARRVRRPTSPKAGA